MEKIAVTGANGFIGSSLCKYLAESGYEVLCLVRDGSDTSLLPSSLNIIYVDYQNMTDIEDKINDCDVLIHSAALTRAKNWNHIKNINVVLTENIINIVNNCPSIRQFIFISSQAAAGPAPTAYGINEEDICKPVSLYGKSKLEAEHQIKDKCYKSWTIIRPVSVFGPGEKDFYEYYKIINKGLSPLIGVVDRFVNLIHVDDLCRMIQMTIGNISAYNECFFASSSETVSMAGFSYILAQILGKKLVELHIPLPILYIAAVISEIFCPPQKFPPLLNRQKYKEMIQRYWIVNNTKAYEKLGFVTDTTLTKQMAKTIEWYLSKDML